MAPPRFVNRLRTRATDMSEAIVTVRPKSYLESSDLGPCYSLLRICTIVFAAIFWLLGILVFIIGITVHADSEFRLAVLTLAPGAAAGATIMIVAGVVMFFAGFVGCFGAIRESRCLLFAFFLVLFTVFVLLVACGIWSDAVEVKIDEKIRGRLEYMVKNYYDYSKPECKDTMDSLQRELNCCGALQGFMDYQNLEKSVPTSCGSRNTACYNKIVQAMQGQMNKIAIIGVVVAIIMLLGIALTLSLCCYLQEATC